MDRTRPPSSARPLRGYIPTLDGWRAIAVCGVIAAHTAHQFGCNANFTTACRVVESGGHGVNLFFAISGLLICSRLLEEEERRGVISLRGFYTRRAFRILPPALLYLAVAGTLIELGIVPSIRHEVLAAATFWRNYLVPLPGTAGWYTGHYWSLSVEEHYYLIWPPLLLLSPKRWRIRIAWTFAVIVGIWRGLDGHFRWVEHASGLTHGAFFIRTDILFDSLLYGCLAALLLSESRMRAWFDWLRGTPGWLGIVAIYCAFILFFPATSLRLTLEALITPLLLLGTVLQPTRPFARLLETFPMRWIGRLSYSIYLWQELFLPDGPLRPLRILQTFPLSFIMILACALASYHLVERPMIRLGHWLAQPATPGRADAEPVAIAPAAGVATVTAA